LLSRERERERERERDGSILREQKKRHGRIDQGTKGPRDRWTNGPTNKPVDGWTTPIIEMGGLTGNRLRSPTHVNDAKCIKLHHDFIISKYK